MATNDAAASPIQNEEIGIDDEAPIPINLSYMPMEILLKIFADLSDFELLQVAGTCKRFESIAQIHFTERYATKYWVIDWTYTESTYELLIEQFQQEIKSIEAHMFAGIDENHWLITTLRKCRHIEGLKFIRCEFDNLKNALIDHPNLTHLTFQGGICFGFSKLPYLHNLKEFKALHFAGLYHMDYLRLIENNSRLKVIEIVNDSFFDKTYEIFECIYEHHRSLDQLHLINEGRALEFQSTNAADVVESVSKGVKSLGISIDHNSIQYLQRLGSNCKNITSLELFHNGIGLGNEMVKAIASFEQMKSFSLTTWSYEEDIISIMEQLPNLKQLSLTYRDNMPTSNDYILTLLQKCKSLNHIIADTYNSILLTQPPITDEFRGNFKKITENRRDLVIFEVKKCGIKLTTVTNKN